MSIFKLFVPLRWRKLDAVETFPVRWKSFHCKYGITLSQEEGQFFTSKEDAKIFEEALKEAAALLRDERKTE